MKFRDGMWLTAEGVRPEYAEEVYSIRQREDGKALSLLCPTKQIRNRGDSLNLSTLHIVSELFLLLFCPFSSDLSRWMDQRADVSDLLSDFLLRTLRQLSTA